MLMQNFFYIQRRFDFPQIALVSEIRGIVKNINKQLIDRYLSRDQTFGHIVTRFRQHNTHQTSSKIVPLIYSTINFQVVAAIHTYTTYI